MYSLAESPSGLVHLIQVIKERGITLCGRECDWDTWMRIRTYDEQIWGKGPRAIKKMIELTTCDRCFKI